MKQFLKIANNGQWYGFAQAEDVQEVMQQHEEYKFLFADFAKRYPGGYILREATPDDLPLSLRRIVEAIEKQDWTEFWQAMKLIGEEPSPSP